MKNSYDPNTNDTNNAFPINQKPRFTHHFIYRTKKFNIDPILISHNSNYFNRNLDKFALCNSIYFEGNEDDPDLSDFIQTFLDICHFNQVQLTEENAIPLYYLSYIYDAQKIKKETEQYIKEHYDHLASKLFQFKINNDKSFFKREIISKNLVYHINHNSTELKSFTIDIIYDIISLYFHQNYKKEEEEQIINFIFDCLNYYGREASVLFTFVDFRKENIKFIQKLTEEFNSVFDFTYINESICKLLSDQNKEISKINLIQASNKIEEKEKTINNLREMNEFYLNEISRLKLENDQLKSNINQTMIESEEEKTVIYIDDNLVYYKLFEKQKVSEVIESPNANGDVVIPASIIFGQIEYKVTRIGENAFKKSEIRTLSFSEKSNLKFICHSAFEDSSIQMISLPSSLRRLDLGWCFGTVYLNEVEVDPQNPYFYVENGVLMYKNERKHEICFVPRNFKGEFIIKENITRIGDYSFANLYNLISVNSLSSTLLIDEGAFLNCNHLKTFNFKFKELKQESEIIIGKICFKGCNSLVSFKIPPTMLVKLGSSAFDDCKKIKSISVEAVSKLVISNQCFFNDNNLSSIKITGDEVLIGNQSFSNCTSITSLSLSNSSRIKICQEAFKGCKWLKKVLLSEQKSNLSNKSIVIESRCFSNCSSLNEFKIEQATDLTLMDFVFENCSKLRKINFCSKVMNIGDECFVGSKINSITLEGEKIIIGNNCFKDCISISSFSIPQTIDVEIGSSCFEGCKNIKQVFIEAVSNIKIKDRCFYNINKLSLIGITCNKLIIGKQCFYNCLSLTSLSLSNINLIFLDENAFERCKNLETVSILARTELEFGNFYFKGNKLKTSDLSDKNIVIGNNCFMDCSSLSEFKIENISNLKLMKSVFLNCAKLESISFNSKMMNIGDECFIGSTIKDVAFEGEEIIIGDNCFKNCQSIITLSIPSSIKVEIGSSCFENCRNIEKVRIETSTKIELKERSFYNDNKMKNIELYSNEINIGSQCFYNCNSITTIIFQEIERIILKTSSFENCQELETITISAKSESKDDSILKSNNISDNKIIIEDRCFMNCVSLSEFNIENMSYISLMKSLFSSCNNLDNININCKIIDIGDECFVGSKISNISLVGDEIKIGNKSFKECHSLTSFSIPSSNDVQFGISCFEDCQNIEEILIQSTSKIEIQERCFYNNINLKSIQIHCDKLIVCKHGFYNCCSLKSFNLSNTRLTTLNENAFERCKSIETISIIYQSKDDISTSSCLSDSSVVIGSNCFIECISLREIKIEYMSHLTLMKDAFYKCRKLESIVLGSKMMNIGDECFIGSTIKDVAFEGEEIIIGDNCFKNCQSIITLSIPSSIKVEIGSSCFENCRNIEKVRIETSTKIELKERSFYNDNKMKNIELYSNEINIGSQCFYNCNSIITINFQEIERIILKTSSFENCQELETITISAKSEIQAGHNCFNNATKLRSIYLDSKKVVINSFCFANCSSLSSFITSSAEEVTLGHQTFDTCKNLETVDVFARSKFKASCFCFNKAYKIKRITVNSRNILIGSHCFDYCSLLSQINCPIAQNINFFENSFNGLHFSECLKHSDEARLNSFKSNSNCNYNECKIV